MWQRHKLKPRYDVVVIGAGVHGLSIAYYLAKNHKITNVADLVKVYLGDGNSGRNAAIIRANYMTVEGVHFYSESLKLYEELSKELNFNLLFSQIGHLSLAHTDSAVNGLWRRAEVNKALGGNSRGIWPDEKKRRVPTLDTSDRPRYPLKGALYHATGGVIRHDAVVWGMEGGVRGHGGGVNPRTELITLDVKDHRAT